MESATGQTELQARNRAIAEVFRSTAMRIGQPFDSEEINRALQRGTEYYVISSQYNIPINKVCEYTDNKVSPCRVYVLCQVAKAGNIRVEFDDFTLCYENANTYVADEALYADGFIVSKNGKKLSDHEIRTLFANSNSYSLYDEGMRIAGMTFDASYTLAMVFGIISITTGVAFQGVFWPLYGVKNNSAKEMKHKLDANSYNHYTYTYDEYKYLYEEELSKATKYKNIAIDGLWLIGGGIALIVAENLMEKAIVSSGHAKIRKAANLYNNGRMYSQGDIELDYGFTGNGVFLTLSF
ncbi:MAG: hypothetical protein IJ057_01810 [Bacteroidales bacterium]|nr:hypothetical protein [Bacteroidales bacterium]